MKYIVGIESTAHTFGVSVVGGKGKILANVKDSYTTEEGGMVPMEVRAHHKKVSEVVWNRALKEAGIDERDVGGIAFSNAPGLAPCLIEGMDFAKAKAISLGGKRSAVGGKRDGCGIPIVGVNHCVAHLVVGETCGAKDPVMLYASGANTQVVAYEGGKFRVFGETLDLGVGNFIDTIARTMGLGFPGGPKIQKLAEGYSGDLLELPYVVKGMDVSFSGMQTKIRNHIDKGMDKGELAYALQETVFAMLVEVAERALAHTGKSELLIGGGVGCNSRLQEMCEKMCRNRGVKFFCPPMSLLVDNGAMIGYLGLKMFDAGLGTTDYDLVDINPRERTDEVICDFMR